jgi:hypothetical protein
MQTPHLNHAQTNNDDGDPCLLSLLAAANVPRDDIRLSHAPDPQITLTFREQLQRVQGPLKRYLLSKAIEQKLQVLHTGFVLLQQSNVVGDGRRQ